MLCATPAWALEVATGQPRERNGLLIVEARFRDLFAPHVAQSIGRGMPATLQPLVSGAATQWRWNGTDRAGAPVGPGMYFARTRDSQSALRVMRVR